MRKKILHLASFEGNVGDILNHQGFYQGIKDLNCPFPDIKQLEIREFYRGNLKFDDSFVDLVNNFDALVIGGGNYFELWVDHSPTGTSVMIEPEIFTKINRPVLFNALGVDLGQGSSQTNINNFKTFIDLVFSNSQNTISLRNDGALKNIKSLFGEEYSRNFIHTPDAGFYAKFKRKNKNKKTCLVNLPGDMVETRYPGGNLHSSESFLEEFVTILEDLINKEGIDSITFIPHIYKDLKEIYKLFEKLPDKIVREKCRVAELNLGQDLKRYKAYYEEASIIFASRFHSNISALKTAQNVIAINNYIQIHNLYEEIDMKEKLLDVQKKGFSEVFFSNLSENDFYKNDTEKFNSKIEQDYLEYTKKILRFFT